MHNRLRSRRARARVREDRPDVRPFLFLMVLTAWMLLWTLDAALAAPAGRSAPVPGPLAAIGSITVDGGHKCTGVLTAQRRVLTTAHCLWDAKVGRMAPAVSVRFVAGLKDGGFRREARVLSYRVGSSSGEGEGQVLLELDGGLQDMVAPLPDMSVESVRSLRIWEDHPKFQAL